MSPRSRGAGLGLACTLLISSGACSSGDAAEAVGDGGLSGDLPRLFGESPRIFGAPAGGSGSGGAGRVGVLAGTPPAIRFSEIMYHPVLEQGFDESHEFLELHNASAARVSLAGWSIEGGVRFAFGAAAAIEPGAYLVVAKDRQRLIDAYDVDPEKVAGEYAGELDNGGELLRLLDAAGRTVEAVEYDDAFPWPVGADALGAGTSWLDASLLPLSDHAGRGRSLERVSFASDGARAASWEASSLDGGTPGAANGAARRIPRPIVEALAFAPLDAGDAAVMRAGSVSAAPIAAGEEVRVTVRFSEHGVLEAPVVEYQVDALTGGGAAARIPLVDDGSAGDAAAGDRVMTATLPAQPARTVVRVRVLADRGDGVEPVTPRASDPMASHAYYVAELIESGVRVYELFVDPDDWSSLWHNIQDGRVSGCELSESWNRRVPARFVHAGTVYDAQLRYQGSRWNRQLGDELASWSRPGPDAPRPPRALSFRVSFPRYARFEGKKAISLNKLNQGCPGLNARVGFALFDAVGIAVPETRYAHLEINGGYFHYTLEIERPGAAMLERFHAAQAASEGRAVPEPVGHLFKSVGCSCDEGPYGWGDGRTLEAHCDHSASARYAATYDRKTHEWAGHAELIELIEGLQAAREAGPDALEDYLRQHFDVDQVLSYLAVMNWAAPFDDMFQNYFLYQRRSDGRWTLLPWDLDENFGGWKGADASLFIGEQGDRDNRSGNWNRFKDAFITVFRAELVARMQALVAGPLAPDAVAARVDATMAEIDLDEAGAAPAGTACDFEAAAETFKRFAMEREQVVMGQ